MPMAGSTAPPPRTLPTAPLDLERFKRSRHLIMQPSEEALRAQRGPLDAPLNSAHGEPQNRYQIQQAHPAAR